MADKANDGVSTSPVKQTPKQGKQAHKVGLKFDFYAKSEGGKYQTPPILVRNDAVGLPPNSDAKSVRIFDTDERHFRPVTVAQKIRFEVSVSF